MIFPQPLGADIRNDHQTTAAAFAAPEKGIGLYRAAGAITVGKAVQTDTADTTGKSVVTGGSASFLLTGIYEGKGGTGAATTVSGLTGNDAQTGDFIWVTCYGPALALTYATATLGAGSALRVAAPGTLSEASNPSAGLNAALISLQAVTLTAAAGTATRVYVKCL